MASIKLRMPTTSEELFKIVKDVLSWLKLPIDKCGYQCYDGAVKGMLMDCEEVES